ncbi:hypothetical protein [Rubrivirga sp.]|uniref:hypothetical protein n=1 Tax=Rubrivirga sp. TaxID=1885344 RepID=UPI003C72096C
MDDRPTCSCGHDRYHHTTRADLTHGGGGWFALFNGLSSTPKRIRFSCAACGETFEDTTDPVVLTQYRRYPYVTRPEGET